MQNILDRFKLKGKIALITGGASGIGRELAIAMGQAGARIAINDRSEENLIKAIDDFAEHGIDIYTIAFDVTDEEAVVHGIKTVQQDVGYIDILVNNAGIIKRVPMLEMATDDFKQVIDVNLVSPLVVSKQVVPGMIKNGGGKIINICSLMSVYGRNSVSAYAAAKGGLMMLTRNMCVEWGKHNIQVNGIGPGYIKTAKTTEYATEGHPFNKLIMMRTPAARWGEVGDLCGAAILLASDAGNFINGQLLFVDGGITANFGYMEGEND
jgi:gluconate 5-dehydrogenase